MNIKIILTTGLFAFSIFLITELNARIDPKRAIFEKFQQAQVYEKNRQAPTQDALNSINLSLNNMEIEQTLQEINNIEKSHNLNIESLLLLKTKSLKIINCIDRNQIILQNLARNHHEFIQTLEDLSQTKQSFLKGISIVDAEIQLLDNINKITQFQQFLSTNGVSKISLLIHFKQIKRMLQEVPTYLEGINKAVQNLSVTEANKNTILNVLSVLEQHLLRTKSSVQKIEYYKQKTLPLLYPIAGCFTLFVSSLGVRYALANMFHFCI